MNLFDPEYDNLNDLEGGGIDGEDVVLDEEDGDEHGEDKQEDDERAYLQSLRDGMNNSRSQAMATHDPAVHEARIAGSSLQGLSNPNNAKIWDFRHGALPENCKVEGGHPAFEAQRDQATALSLVPAAKLRMQTGGMKNGGEKLNSYTLTMDIKVAKLPVDGLSLYQSNSEAGRPTEGEVYLYPSGGVGVFGEHGAPAARVKPGKWTRITVTQQEGQKLTTYVNGRKCAELTAASRGVIGQVDGRFALNPEAFYLCGSTREALMPGLQLKYAELAPVCLGEDQVREQAQHNRVYSYWEAQRQADQARVFAGMSLRPLYKRAPPVWGHPAFLGAFGDAFLEGTGMDGGALPPSVAVLGLALQAVCAGAQEPYLGAAWGHAERQALSAAAEAFRAGQLLAQRFALGVKNGTQLVAFLKRLRARLEGLKEGDKMLVPGGIGGHPLLFIVEREEGGRHRFVVINTHPLAGLGYHQASAAEAPNKIKYKTCLVLPNVDQARLLDDAFWGLLLKLCCGQYDSKFNTPDRVYDLLLPYLVDKPLEAALAEAQEDPAAEWRSPQRAGAAHYKCASEAVFYLLRRQGLPAPRCKQALLALRMENLAMAANDLGYLSGLAASDRRVVEMACQGAAYAAVKLSDAGVLTAEQLARVKADVEAVAAAAAALPCADAGASGPPGPLALARAVPQAQPGGHPLVDRLRRLEDVDGLAGAPIVPPRYVPADALLLPARVENLEDAVAALRHCDRLCTLYACQPHHLKNTSFLKASLIQYTFCYLVPVPKPQSARDYHSCVWAAPMRYALQLDVTILLQRLMEHFAASAFSLKASKCFDAVRITVPACMAAICDAALRKRATDIPSDLSLALMGEVSGQGYGLGTGWFGAQSETIEVHTAELNIARTSVLDYFDAQTNLTKIFPWEKGNHPDADTLQFLASTAAPLAYPTSGEALIGYIADDKALVVKNYPEFGCYRDIAFYFKYFLNPDAQAFPQPIIGGDHAQRSAGLNWDFQQGQFVIQAFRMPLAAVPAPQPGVPPPTHRYPSAATPGFLTAPHPVRTEDDVLHIKSLPTFDDALGQADGEALISYLTVPYMRIPLVLTFFSTEDRVHALRSQELRTVLDSVLFEPGRYLSRNARGAPTMVPEPDQRLLATPYGLLLNELQRSPTVVVDSARRLLKLALDLDTGTAHSSTAEIILYVVRTVARVENHVAFLLQYAAGTHETLPPTTALRDVTVAPEVVAELTEALAAIREVLRGPVHVMLEAWTGQLMDECAGRDDDEIFDANSRLACGLHAHILLVYRNVEARELTPELVAVLMCSFVFLNTRHAWNMDLLPVPETEVYELLATCRRKVVQWGQGRAAPGELDAIMEAVVRVAAGTGRRRERVPAAAAAADPAGGDLAAADRRRWGRLGGARSRGRFVVAPRTYARGRSWAVGVPEVPDDGRAFGVEVDLQAAQLTLKSSHMKALDKAVAGRPDVVRVFGTASMQASTVESTQHRELIHLVGRGHDLAFWRTPDPRPCLLEFDRDYSPGEVEESEEWIVPLFEPVRLTYMTKPFPIQICLPEDPLPARAQVACLVAVHPKSGGTWKEIFVFRALGAVHVYDVHSHGRRFYRTLEYSSDARACLRELQPATDDRQGPWPRWERHGAGHPLKGQDDPASVVITRAWDHPANLSGGRETFLPDRLLHGLLPAALLGGAYAFWQDEDDNLRGYPEDDSGTFLIKVELYGEERVAATALPGHVASVRRLLRARAAGEYRATLKAIDAVGESELVQGEWEVTYAAFQGLRALVRRYGGAEPVRSAVGLLKEGGQEAEDVGALLESLRAYMEMTHGPGTAEAADGGSGGGAGALDEAELTLLAPLYAPEGSDLFNTARALLRIENLSHMLPWTREANPSRESCRIDLLELPRLKLSFQEKEDDEGVRRLYSLDHAAMFVAPCGSPVVADLLRGLPHSLLLQTATGEVQVLVPSIDPVRPFIGSAPFSTELVLNRANGEWASVLDTAYYMYPIHISLSFLFCPTLASSIYLLLLRFLNRDYDAVFRLVEGVGTDADFSPEEAQAFAALGYCNGDAHPNAHACRLKIALVTIDAAAGCPWDLTREMSRWVQKLPHVAAACRLGHEEELQLLEHCILTVEDPRFDPKVYTEYEVTLNRNRKLYLEALLAGRPEAPAFACPRPRTSGWPNRADFSILEAGPADWGQLALEYAAPRALTGALALDHAHQFWSGQETLGGAYARSGFLFLYELLTGTVKVKLLKEDCSHGYATLLFQLYADADQPSLLASIINILIRNPGLKHKLPPYKDNRKYKHNTVNAWPDEGDETSPLSELLTLVQPIIMTELPGLRMAAEAGSLPQLAAAPPTLAVKPEGPRDWFIPQLRDYACAERPLRPLGEADGAPRELWMGAEELAAFAGAPLGVLDLGAYITQVTASQLGKQPISEELPFDVSGHKQADSEPARLMTERLRSDMKIHADAENNKTYTRLSFLLDTDINAIAAGQEQAAAAALARLDDLAAAVGAIKAQDAAYVAAALGELEAAANAATPPPAAPGGGGDAAAGGGGDAAATAACLRYQLRRFCGQEARVWLEFLFGSVLSSRMEEDLTNVNPFLDAAKVPYLRALVVAAVLRASRAGQCNRCLEDVAACRRLVRRLARPGGDRDAEGRIGLRLKAESLAGNLGAARHFVEGPVDGEEGARFDPRFLVFEFTWNIVLRKAQVGLVRDIVGSIQQGTSLVKQMIMGGGKTTVISPLIVTMLDDGRSLVTQVVPPALLEFSRGVMRSTFGSIMKKRIYTLAFDRTTEPTPALHRKLTNAVRTHGVVITTPTSLKSVQLKFLETLDLIKDDSRPRHPDMERDARELGQILRLFRGGVLVMDEVDLILHPMKSELNFPVGEKLELDFSPLRWQLPIHLLDAVFYAARGRMSVGFRSSRRAVQLLEDVAEALREGYRDRALQRNPHVVLLNPDWYHARLKPPMAAWLRLWLQSQHLSGLTDGELTTYLLEGANQFKNAELAAKVEANLQPKHKKMLNLAHDWLRSYLPHVLQKIDRVSFGIFNKGDYDRAIKADPHMPRSRAKLAVPFVGKDVPSRSSEFAHPDVIIGLTVLAYRYEGLRWGDFEDLVTALQQTLTKETGPHSQRKSSLRHAAWVEEAGGRVRGRNHTYDTSEAIPEGKEAAADEEEDDQYDDAREVVPLRLLKRSNEDQMRKLYALLRGLPDVVHWYLENFVFPAFMRHQVVKISSCGQEVGGEALFGRRVGFSGTPSDLIPLELGRCGYEKGSDGLMIRTLTDPAVTGYEVVEEDWTVTSLLDRIATSERRYHALIDTGALITGMTNYQVARYLLDKGLPWCQGAVFLDEADRKMILVRATGRVLKLEQCGLPADRRFAFYDQVHTTGMDIKHTHNARAVMTLGKDMVFRDYAQGAFRMRGINKGQSIHVYLIPEVDRLIARELGSAGLAMRGHEGEVGGAAAAGAAALPVLVAVTAWLVVNSMRSERVQFNQLCLQNAANVWRKAAYSRLLGGYEGFSCEAPRQAPDLLRALAVFSESIDFSLEAGVPQPVAFADAIQEKVDKQQEFIDSDAARATVERVLQSVRGAVLDAGDQALNAEMVQEQEEEKEKQQEQEQEQEIEIEKYVDLAYSRDHEEPTPWPFAALGDPGPHPFFYPAADFKLYKRRPVGFPEYLHISDNYFDKRWGGARRVKNAALVLEWAPGGPATVGEARAELAAAAPEDDEQLRALEQAIDLFDLDNSGAFEAEELQRLAKAISNQSFSAGEVAAFAASVGASAERGMTSEELQQLIALGSFRRFEPGRRYVVLSLAEAETVRRVMHLRQGRPAVDGAPAFLALRCIPADNLVLDSSHGYVGAGYYQNETMHQSVRFLDCAMHYAPPQLNMLVQALSSTPAGRRRRFFEQVLGCRRRLARRWLEAPVAAAFKLASMFALFRQKAQVQRLREAIRRKGMFLYDAFVKFDHSRNGLLSPGELYGAVHWLGIAQMGPEDVLDFLDLADTSGDGNISYQELVDLLAEDPAEAEAERRAAEEGGGGGGGEGPPPAALPQLVARASSEMPEDGGASLPTLGRLVSARPVEPKDEELLRRLREERAKRALEAEAQELEAEAAEEARVAGELRAEEDAADAAQEGGRNPKVEGTNVHYTFSTGRRPRGMTSRGDFKYEAAGAGEGQVLRAFPGCVLFLPLPFGGAGAGAPRPTTPVASYTLTLELSLDRLPLQGQLGALLSAAPHNEGDAALHVDSHGRVGRGQAFGEVGGPALRPGQWHTLQVRVAPDQVEVFVDGARAAALEQPGAGAPLALRANDAGAPTLTVFGSRHADECRGGRLRMLMADAALLSAEELARVAATVREEREGNFKMLVVNMLVEMGIGADVAAWAVEASAGATVEQRVQAAFDLINSAS